MTYICYRGIEVSAMFQKVLLSIELVMLLVLSVTAFFKIGTGHAPATSVHPSASWLLPTHLPISAFLGGIILMLFIYWGWDTAVSVNEETKDKNRPSPEVPKIALPVTDSTSNWCAGFVSPIPLLPIPANDCTAKMTIA